jgi:hypothetical protein
MTHSESVTSAKQRSWEWRDATAVVAVIVTVLLAARQLRPLIESATFRLRTGEVMTNVTVATWSRAGGWLAITAALLWRQLRIAAAGAWLAVVFEVAVVFGVVGAGPRVWGDPRLAVAADLAAWPVLLALVAAIGLTVVAVAGRGPDLLSRRGWWLLAAAGVVTAGSAVAQPLAGGASPSFFAIEEHTEAGIALTTRAVVLLAAGLVLFGVHRGLRGRAAIVLAAGMAGALAIQIGLPLPLGASNLTPPDRVVQAYGLILGPLLILGLGVLRYRVDRYRWRACGPER